MAKGRKESASCHPPVIVRATQTGWPAARWEYPTHPAPSTYELSRPSPAHVQALPASETRPSIYQSIQSQSVLEKNSMIPTWITNSSDRSDEFSSHNSPRNSHYNETEQVVQRRSLDHENLKTVKRNLGAKPARLQKMLPNCTEDKAFYQREASKLCSAKPQRGCIGSEINQVLIRR